MSDVLRRQRRVDEYNLQYTFNPYNGCAYGCIYCYSTRSDYWKELWDRIGLNPIIPKPKKDVIMRLEKDIDRLQDIPAEEKEVQIGNTFDPYPSIESKQKITRGCLGVFNDNPDWKVHIVTKSYLILKDVDILRDMADSDRFVEVEITITTLSHDKYFEPNVPSTDSRLHLIKELSSQGIYVRVMLMPILNNDKVLFTDVEKIKQIVSELGAKDVKADRLHDDRYPELSLKNLVAEYGIPLP